MTSQNHERWEQCPMGPHTIQYGAATVVGFSIGRSRQRAWVFPGGYYTTSKARAESVAAKIDRLMRRKT